ncbi:MAG: hypothetical protein JWM34_731 [Ilumatobacteraceae bacterium]|nr:hypothetical protein [Ilumatobacteraceae bacterium]
MGIFGRSSAAAEHEWQGRSLELPDAGAVTWKVVWDALAVDDPPGPTGMGPIGLRSVRVATKDDPTSVYHGERHGHWVQIRQMRSGRELVMMVWVGVAAADFTIVGADGRLVALPDEGEVPPLPDELVDARVWNGLRCTGDALGIVTRRVVSNRFPQGWMYDLWLAEALAVETGAVPLPAPGAGDDPATWLVPHAAP